MSLAAISLIALGLVVLASIATRVNPGVLAIVLAWLIGVYAAPAWGEAIPLREIVGGFPVSLFLTLVAVTLLFTQASVNGTLDRVAAAAVRWCRGNAGATPIMFFVLAFVFASVGAGNIAASALISPMAMATASRARIPAFLMTIMVGHGAIAGALSPISPTGVIAGSLMRDQLGLAGFEWAIYAHNMVANAVVGIGGYLLLGGWRLFSRGGAETPGRPREDMHLPGRPAATGDGPAGTDANMTATHWVTLAVIAALVIGVIGFGVDVGMGAFAGAVILALGGLADPEAAVRRMPWSVMLMVCGVTVLTALLDRTGGSQLITDFVGHIAGPETVTGIIAFLAGIISVYSSTSGVVLPAFLPMVGGIAAAVGGGDPLLVASSMIVGGHLVDSSPLSTIGALAIACAPVEEDRRLLFNRVLAWGLSMSVIGAIYCYVFFGLLS